MKTHITRSAATAALLGTAATLPAAHVFAATHSAATHVTAKSMAAKAKKYKGPVVEMDRWGPLQAAITVKNYKITNVTIASQPDNPRSQFIQSQAAPLLRSETLQAQSANIDMVSGATDMSQAYIQSLQGAIDKAKAHKALK